MQNKKYSVVAIGNAMLDLVCEVPEQFLKEEGISKGAMNLVSMERSNNILKIVRPIKETAGGSAANTISTLAKLGLKTGYIGKIADDPKGKVFKKDLIDSSIYYNTEFLDISNTEATGKCIVLITPDKERTMNTYLGATEFLTEIDIDEELIAHSEWLYLEGYRFDGQKSKEAFYKAIEIAKRNKTKMKFASNNAGGILGGISSGQDIIVSFAVKPTSSILKRRKTIDKFGKNTSISVKGRHDPCVGIRAVPIGEAMMHCVLLDHYLMNKAQ